MTDEKKDGDNVVPFKPTGSSEHDDGTLLREFIDRYARTTRHVDDWSRWMLYDDGDGVWQRDDLRAVYDRALAVLHEHAIGAALKGKAKQRVVSASRVDAVLRLVKAHPAIAAFVTQWDGALMVINCRGEVFVLDQDSYSRIAIPGDYFTKTTEIRPQGDCPLWIGFLELVTGGDAELMDYLQRVAGYCLTGSTREQVLFFVYGPGGNGKTTFINTLARIMGDYARIASIDTFTASNNDRHPTELARLQGARLVVASETTQGREWDETKIKMLTGGETIAARFMRQDFFEYTPQFKVMISGNNKPELRGVDEAWRRRFHIIPFTVKISDEQRIFNFEEQLKDEWPGILQWAIEGARYWAQVGLRPPKAVIEATEEYLETEDIIGAWLEECTERDPAAFEKCQVLFSSWRDFAKRTGEPVRTQKWLTHQLQRIKGVKYGRSRPDPAASPRRGFYGLRLLFALEA